MLKHAVYDLYNGAFEASFITTAAEVSKLEMASLSFHWNSIRHMRSRRNSISKFLRQLDRLVNDRVIENA
ncbi:MAG: hypothetical protein ACKERG_01140 [Candidatus Hodgkinia cicadicola]